MAMIIGYARVSTTDQSLNAQHDALAEVGAHPLFSERVSGARVRIHSQYMTVAASAMADRKTLGQRS